MKLVSTRDVNNEVEALSGVVKGISEEGGLYVPKYFPEMAIEEIKALSEVSYSELANNILGKFFDIEELQTMCEEAYASFDCEEVVPLTKAGDAEYIMELYHGPTLAFKDMALQMLPRLLSCGLKKQGGKALILTATSGDTGKAALEGFKDVDNTRIVVFYPEQGVSDMQKLQMVTQEGSNTHICAVRGNFDDAQTGVKQIFASEEFRKLAAEKGYSLSSANSINFGRLAPQIAYYFYAYAQLVKKGEIKAGDTLNFTVPTGNFGNILAGYYAKRMGLPVGKLICASNKNNILTDFFKTGKYDLNREFYQTTSPSMDILISSNLERLLFELVGRDSDKVNQLMNELKTKGVYEISDDIKNILASEFFAGYCTDEEASQTIKHTFEKEGVVLDTHTAVAQRVYENYVKETGDNAVNVVVSTANPYKFAQDVSSAVTGTYIADAFEAASELNKVTKMPIPNAISGLKTAKILHDSIADKDDLANAVARFI